MHFPEYAFGWKHSGPVDIQDDACSWKLIRNENWEVDCRGEITPMESISGYIALCHWQYVFFCKMDFPQGFFNNAPLPQQIIVFVINWNIELIKWNNFYISFFTEQPHNENMTFRGPSMIFHPPHEGGGGIWTPPTALWLSCNGEVIIIIFHFWQKTVFIPHFHFLIDWVLLKSL